MVYFVNWLWVDSTVYMVKTSQDSLLKRILIIEPHLTSIPKTELLKNSLTKTRLIWSNSCIKKGLKVYLCYKTINSWNVPSKVQIKNFFISKKNYVPFSRYSSFLTIPLSTKSVTSRWVLVHETRCIFEYIFWTTNHEVTTLGQLTDISKYNNFQQSFEQFGRLGLDSRSFSS